MTTDEAGLEGPAPGATDKERQPVDGIGQVRAYGPVSDCCKAAPAVLEFDSEGKLLRAWGGPSDPGFIGGKCKAEAGCIWPSSEHGIYVDQNDNVWLSGNSDARTGRGSADVAEAPWATNKAVGGTAVPGAAGRMPMPTRFYRLVEMFCDAAVGPKWVAAAFSTVDA